MSEFSESYHLRTNSKDEGKKLIKSLGIRGIVFEETNGWVTVLPEGDLNSQIENVASAYAGTVLHYMYAEDHAWMTNLFLNGNKVSGFICAWDPELYIENESLNIEELSKLLVKSENRSKLEKLFSLGSIEEIFETNPAYSFADLLGIEHYQWLAGHGIEKHGSEIVESITGAEIVGKNASSE